MNSETKKVIYLNAQLLAYVDGHLDEEERRILAALEAELDVDAATVARWQQELREGPLQFRPLPDHDAARRMLAVATGVVAADGQLEPRERRALIELAKALEVTFDELEEIYLATWGRDALAVAFPKFAEVTIDQTLVVADHFENLDDFAIKAQGVRLTRTTLEELRRRQVVAPGVIFHSAPALRDSQEALGIIQRAVKAPVIVLVAARAAAPQISYLREVGITRCIVEPVYPGEVPTVLAELGVVSSPR